MLAAGISESASGAERVWIGSQNPSVSLRDFFDYIISATSHGLIPAKISGITRRLF